MSIVFKLEIDMEKIFTDENTETTSPSLQIDFSKALWATNALYEIFHNAGVPLNDVDFIAETDEELIFVECKNANRIDAANPDSFNPKEDKKLTIIAKEIFFARSGFIFRRNISGKNLTEVYKYKIT